MRVSIFSKLTFAFVSLTALVLIATLTLARWSFERGFLDYVNALELERLERAASLLATEYVRQGDSWDALTVRQFRRLTQGYGGGDAFPDRRPPGPPPTEGQRAEGRPPPPGRGGPPPGGPSRSSPPTALINAQQQPVMGAQFPTLSENHIRVPVVVDDNTVGILVSLPRQQFTSVPETAFAQRQLRASWLIGAGSLMAALLVSALLARGLLAPVRRMVSAVHTLSNGDYTARLNESRTDELGRLMNNLDRLGTKLEHSQSSRRRWLADISHELRTPVTVLTGELQAIKDGIRPFDQTQADSLAQEVERLRLLIDDLYELSLSDIGGLRYTFADVDLERMLQESHQQWQARCSQQELTLSLSTPGPVHVNADAQRLNQVLRNLFNNSLAYTREPGRIDITLKTTGKQATLTLDDSPPGISDEDCERLFEPLFRAENSRSRRTGGTGLGLAICRNVIEAHGGHITASQSPLGGLSIRLDIPLQNSGAA